MDLLRDIADTGMDPSIKHLYSSVVKQKIEDAEEKRPIYKEMLRRSTVNWGEAPHYTPDYKKIRWSFKEEGSIVGHMPVWKTRIRYALEEKSNGTWNNRGFPYTKGHTGWALKRDLYVCVKNNIPFKTRTIEYKPTDQWIYIKGQKILKYSLENGCLTHLTYSGVYDKVVSFLLRKLFHFEITKKNGKLGMETNAYGRMNIDINQVYDLTSNIFESESWRKILNGELWEEAHDYEQYLYTKERQNIAERLDINEVSSYYQVGRNIISVTNTTGTNIGILPISNDGNGHTLTVTPRVNMDSLYEVWVEATARGWVETNRGL